MAGKGLGRGLDALIPDTGGLESSAVLQLPIERIEPSRSQPRRIFDEESLAGLSESIKQHGMIQPLTVRSLPNGYYQIITGERRWRASRMAGLTELPAIVLEADDRKVMELALVENLQREDLTPIEEAEGYRSLIDGFGLTQDEVARRVGRSRPSVANALRLLGLPEELKKFLEDGLLSGGHARALLTLPEPFLQVQAAKRVVERGLSVRQTEELVKKLATEPRDEIKVPPGAVDYAAEAANELSKKLGRGVKISGGKKKGRLELEFYGVEDLNVLLELLSSLGEKYHLSF